MDGKVVPLEEAAGLVRNGDVLGLGGYTLYRKPMAFVREVIRSRRRDLTVASFAGSIDVDLLIGSGVASTVRSCYVGMEYLGLAPSHRRFAESNRIKIVEESELTFSAGLRAALQRTPCLLVRQLFETDMLKVRPDIRETTCPLTGERLVALPAVAPNVAAIHVLEADPYGNAYFRGNAGVDRELARVSDKVILTAEKLVATEELGRRAEGVQICSFEVHAVVVAPWGAHPTSCYPHYTLDMWHLNDYVKMARDDDQFESYLRKYVFDCLTTEDYVQAVGGIRSTRRVSL